MPVAAIRPPGDIAFAELDVVVGRRADGTISVEPVGTLGAYPSCLQERLEYWAAETPDRVFLAERAADGSWRTVTYEAALSLVRRIGEALLSYDLSPERPLVILSGNSVDHALLGFAAMQVGVPYAPVTPAYALAATGFEKLRFVFDLLTPGLVFADDGMRFARAIDAVWPADAPLLVSHSPPPGRPAALLSDLAARVPTAAVDRARSAIGPDTIAKFLLTSGSTGQPKAVITTQRMLAANQVMIRETLAFLKAGPPVLVDWLPWNHTFGGSHNVGLALFNGGTFHVDAGKPTAEGIGATLANLREIAPTIYFNVPKGFEMLLPHFRREPDLRRRFFSRLQAMYFAGAGLADHVWQELDEIAIAETGRAVPILSGLGSTETAPFALASSPTTTGSGRVGLPVPGTLLKLVPVDEKLEARIKGPNVTPGYWRRPDLTAEAFDDEGFYRLGDALRFVDPERPAEGFYFDGRVKEDFKLASGTWVSVGPLKARFIAHFAPLVRDAVFAGINRDFLTALVIVDPEACAAAASTGDTARALTDLVADEMVRRTFRDRLTAFARTEKGSASQVMRIILLDTPPSLDLGEITDKGSINQRAVLAHRQALVDDLYADNPPLNVIAAEGFRP
jgi:feruloyl-CoA synthase